MFDYGSDKKWLNSLFSNLDDPVCSWDYYYISYFRYFDVLNSWDYCYSESNYNSSEISYIFEYLLVVGTYYSDFLCSYTPDYSIFGRGI